MGATAGRLSRSPATDHQAPRNKIPCLDTKHEGWQDSHSAVIATRCRKNSACDFHRSGWWRALSCIFAVWCTHDDGGVKHRELAAIAFRAWSEPWRLGLKRWPSLQLLQRPSVSATQTAALTRVYAASRTYARQRVRHMYKSEAMSHAPWAALTR